MKTLWFFVILAAVNGEVCTKTDDQGNPTTVPSNKWGEACDKTCGKCSDEQGCDKENGHCISKKCAEGWQGDKCNECAVGRWGEAEGDTQEVSIDPTIFIDNLLFSVRKHAGNVATKQKVAIKHLAIVIATNAPKAGREINVLQQCGEKIRR